MCTFRFVTGRGRGICRGPGAPGGRAPPRKNPPRQPSQLVSTSRPPRSGPPTVATAITPPSRPEYRPRSRGLIIAAIAICTSACRPPRPRPCSTRQAISASTDCEEPASIEPTMKITIDSWMSSFLLNRSASLPQIGVEAVEESSVAVTTQVYWLWVPRRSVMIVGRALETTVEDRKATNIASNIPDSAERISRWVIRPWCTAGAGAAGSAAGGGGGGGGPRGAPSGGGG